MLTERPQRIVLASGNAGKLREFSALLASWDCEVLPQSTFAVPSVDETGTSFAENALLKAHGAAEHSGLQTLCDVSFIAVDALDGAPGVFSARFAGVDASAAENNQKLLQALADVPEQQRTARFHCALVYLRHWQDPNPVICQASWEGRILLAARGEQGFGYDPLFYVPDHDCSAAQLNTELKNRISHRGQALVKLRNALHEIYF
jgi:XTP/dITP diphosphohydrolase